MILLSRKRACTCPMFTKIATSRLAAFPCLSSSLSWRDSGMEGMKSAPRAIGYALIATVLAAVAPPANAAPWMRPGSITILGDRGGEVIRYALRVKKAEKAGQSVRFAGRCDSACTLFLSMPRSRTCITPRASFGFHLPYGASPRGNQLAASYMMRKYPGWVRNWIAANGGLSRHVKTMNYEYASRYLPACGDNGRRDT